MQLVPITPQQKIGVETSLEVTGGAAVKPAKPVIDRALPPLLTYAHEQPDRVSSEITPHEKRQLIQQADRRIVCPRFQHLPILEKPRLAIDIPRHKQRSTDYRLHIDEEA